MQLGLEQVLDAGGYRAYSTHFGAIAEDGRFTPAPARGRVQPDGQGVRVRRRGRPADRRADVRGDRPARRDAVHRDVRDGLRARRDPDEPHGGGQLGDGAARPPGAADQAPARHRRARGPADVPVRVRDRPGARWRRWSCSATSATGSWSARARSSTPRSCRRSRCHTGSSAPTAACARCMDDWLRNGGPHHQVLNRGRRARRWALLLRGRGDRARQRLTAPVGCSRTTSAGATSSCPVAGRRCSISSSSRRTPRRPSSAKSQWTVVSGGVR